MKPFTSALSETQAPSHADLADVVSELRQIKTLLRLNLFTAGGSLPTTVIGPNFQGSTIGTTNEYRPIYKNNYARLIALKVTAEFAVPGAAASLSMTTDLSNNGRIALLTSTGPVISETIWLKPEDTLYINTADTAFTLTGSVFRVLLFDPLAFQPTFLSTGV
jgi:hypothetical protein